MASLRTAMDANFHDLQLSSPHNLDGSAKSVPGEPIPLDGARASKALRVQQLSLLSNGFPLGLIPSISSVGKNNEVGSFSVQSLLVLPSFGPWWAGLVGQFRPKKLISKVKLATSSNEWDMHTVKEAAKHLLDKSLYSLGTWTHIPITSTSSLLVSSESHGERKRRQDKLMLYHKLPFHDITLDASWPDLFIDSKGRYWNVPESISLDLSSKISESGLRYRVGLHKNSGEPEAISSIDGDDAPAALLPGLCANAAFSYEKHRDIWRVKEKPKDCIIETDRGFFLRPAYDVRMKEPHASVSAIIGGVCGTWLWGEGNPSKLTPHEDAEAGNSNSVKRSRVFADLFGSMSSTFQHGKFRKPLGDLTRVDARLDFCSASGFIKNVASLFRKSSDSCQENSVGLPRLGLIFQQQIAGPIVFRIDSKYVLKPNPGWKNVLENEDFMYSLSYSLRVLESGKVVAWYSPKRKEGMIELRLFEF